MFRDLPVVLIDIVTSFAWDMPYEEVFLLTCIACEVNQWQLPEMFIRKHRTDCALGEPAESAPDFQSAILPRDLVPL